MSSIMCSMMIETRTRTKQTTATAHVGVCSNDLPEVDAAIYGSDQFSQPKWSNLNIWNERIPTEQIGKERS